jgi:hypothetical protein
MKDKFTSIVDAVQQLRAAFTEAGLSEPSITVGDPADIHKLCSLSTPFLVAQSAGSETRISGVLIQPQALPHPSEEPWDKCHPSNRWAVLAEESRKGNMKAQAEIGRFAAEQQRHGGRKRGELGRL